MSKNADDNQSTNWQDYYDAGWDAALSAVRKTLPTLPTYDENGYITKWADLLHALKEMQRND